MKFFTPSFAIQAKQKLGKLWFPLLLVFLLLASLLLTQLAKTSPTPLSFTAGVAYASDDPFGVALMGRLEGMDMIDFQPLPDRNQAELRALVENKSYDTIYILKENLEARIVEGRINNAIPSLVSPRSSLSTFLDKWVFANALIEASPQISLQELSQTVGVPVSELAPMIQESFTWYEEHYQFVVAQPQWLGKEGFPPVDRSPSLALMRLSRGLLCLVLLVYTALCLGQSMDSQKIITHRLPLKENRVFALGGFTSFWATSLLLGAPTLLVLNLFGLPSPSLWLDVLALILFTFFLSGLVVFLSCLLPSREGLVSLTIFTLLLTLVFGGLVFDPLEVSQLLDRVAHFLPTYYYMGAVVSENPLYLLYLFFGGLLLFGLALIKITPLGQRRP